MNKVFQAVAGSGKTTTVIKEIRGLLESTSKTILYVVFNKSMQQEAELRLPMTSRLQVRTMHSLAYEWARNTDYFRGRAVIGDFTGTQIKDKLGVTGAQASAMLQVWQSYLTSDFPSLKDFVEHVGKSYLSQYNLLPRDLNDQFEDIIEDLNAVTHGQYMKAFQLSKPVFNFDVIVVDEFQDWNAAYIDVIEGQDAELILAGDKAQAIYGWNGADSNKFQKSYEMNVLDGSWRCPEPICRHANAILNLFDADIRMRSNSSESAIVALADWDQHVQDSRKDVTIITRNNAQAYTYANRLVNSNKNINVRVGLDSDGIKNHWLWLRKIETGTYLDKFRNEADLQRFYVSCFLISKSSMLACAKQIKDWPLFERRLGEFEPDRPSVLITNVFQAKGLEWDNVFVADDFKKIEELKSVISDSDLAEIYVAITRAKKELYLPTHLFKEDFSISKCSQYFDSSMFDSVYRKNTAIINANIKTRKA